MSGFHITKLPGELQLSREIPIEVEQMGPIYIANARRSLGKEGIGAGLSVSEAIADLADDIVRDYVCFKAFCRPGSEPVIVRRLESYLVQKASSVAA